MNRIDYFNMAASELAHFGISAVCDCLIHECRKIIDKETFFDVLLIVHLSIFISVINQLDVQNFCFTISLFHASTCFEHMFSSSGGQNSRGCVMQF